MRIISHANRGQALEAYLNFVHGNYRNLGIACINKIPTPFIPIRGKSGKIVSVKVEEKSTVDYVGRYKGVPVAIEAKHTNERRIRFDRVQEHQAAYFDSWTQEQAGFGIVLVSFKLNRFFAVPWPFWSAGIRAWQKREKLLVSYGGWEWETPGKASVSATELLPAWEVKKGGRTGLDYLRLVEVANEG